MQTHYNVLGYRIDLYFHDYNLAIETDENGSKDRNIVYEIATEYKIGCKFIRIDHDKKDFDIF